MPVPAGHRLTAQGTRLALGAAATVIFETSRHRGSVLRLTVRAVRRGRLADFTGFILDSSYKRKAAYYYAQVSVRNVGSGDVGGVAVPLWGVNTSNTLLPAVNFTTRFAPCPSKSLPARFAAGASMNTCLVYLSPNGGALRSVSYRPNQQFDPIIWAGAIGKPKPVKKTVKKRPTKKKHR